MRLIADHEHTTDHCPTCGSGIRREPHGELYAGWHVVAGQRQEIRKVPADTFRDPINLDELTQYFDGGLYRKWPSEAYFSRGGKKLHRDAWTQAFGPIPRGCHIHHKDGDPGNNQLDNLECIEASAHLSLSARQRALTTRPEDYFTETARAKAAEWHGSPEGKLWHSRHALRTKGWTKWKHEDKPCEHCGTIFSALVRKSGNAGKFCSSACKAAAYRGRGKNNEYAQRYRDKQAALKTDAKQI